MADGRATPDLHSILATLAQFAPPVTPSDAEVGTNWISAPNGSTDGVCSDRHSVSHETHSVLGHSNRPQSSGAAARPTIDPATITTWQDGLRCVTKIAAQNPQFGGSIRRMIAAQRNEELRWYSERQQLKRLQAQRQLSAARAQSILSSLGTGSAITSPAAEEVDGETELAEFDRGIYVSQQRLNAVMTAELKALGVPFFGTDANLVIAEGAHGQVSQAADSLPPWSPLVSSSQLQTLQKRMVSHLEDLYRD